MAKLDNLIECYGLRGTATSRLNSAACARP